MFLARGFICPVPFKILLAWSVSNSEAWDAKLHSASSIIAPYRNEFIAHVTFSLVYGLVISHTNFLSRLKKVQNTPRPLTFKKINVFSPAHVAP